MWFKGHGQGPASPTWYAPDNPILAKQYISRQIESSLTIGFKYDNLVPSIQSASYITIWFLPDNLVPAKQAGSYQSCWFYQTIWFLPDNLLPTRAFFFFSRHSGSCPIIQSQPDSLVSRRHSDFNQKNVNTVWFRSDNLFPARLSNSDIALF